MSGPLPAYSDTGYSDKVTPSILVSGTLLIIMTVLTVLVEGVTVIGKDCSDKPNQTPLVIVGRGARRSCR